MILQALSKTLDTLHNLAGRMPIGERGHWMRWRLRCCWLLLRRLIRCQVLLSLCCLFSSGLSRECRWPSAHCGKRLIRMRHRVLLVPGNQSPNALNNIRVLHRRIFIHQRADELLTPLKDVVVGRIVDVGIALFIFGKRESIKRVAHNSGELRLARQLLLLSNLIVLSEPLIVALKSEIE